VKLSLCFNLAPRHEGVVGSGGVAPRILDRGARWRWVVTFTPRPLYPQGKSPWYPSDGRLGGPQSRSGRGGEEKNFQPLQRLEPRIIHSVVQRSNYEGRLVSSWTHLITSFTFSRNGWSVVRNASLAKGGISKKRPSPHFHKLATRSNKVSLLRTSLPRLLQKCSFKTTVTQTLTTVKGMKITPLLRYSHKKWK
jgi:hypothetical protein